MTESEQQILLTAILEIAHATWFCAGRRSHRFSRDECVDRARRAAIELGLDWTNEKPERRDHRAALSATLRAIEARPVVTNPPANTIGRPPKLRGMDAFVAAGKGAR